MATPDILLSTFNIRNRQLSDIISDPAQLTCTWAALNVSFKAQKPQSCKILGTVPPQTVQRSCGILPNRTTQEYRLKTDYKHSRMKGAAAHTHVEQKVKILALSTCGPPHKTTESRVLLWHNVAICEQRAASSEQRACQSFTQQQQQQQQPGNSHVNAGRRAIRCCYTVL